MKGKQYDTGVQGHKLLWEALGICEWDAFVSKLKDTSDADEILSALTTSTEKVAELCNTVADMLHDVVAKVWEVEGPTQKNPHSQNPTGWGNGHSWLEASHI